MIERLRERFPDWDLKYSIGGQISFDVFPNGWDKTFCLQFITNDFNEIHFFGDKTLPVHPAFLVFCAPLQMPTFHFLQGGNDYEIFSHPAVTGHSVTSPQHTMQLVRELFMERKE
jgi:phosphomannomutase